jgi:hypothetical protein
VRAAPAGAPRGGQHRPRPAEHQLRHLGYHTGGLVCARVPGHCQPLRAGTAAMRRRQLAGPLRQLWYVKPPLFLPVGCLILSFVPQWDSS